MAANMTDDLVFSLFFIEIENVGGEGKILMRYTYNTSFSEKNLDFYKIKHNALFTYATKIISFAIKK
jgi:hypothetical protein